MKRRSILIFSTFTILLSVLPVSAQEKNILNIYRRSLPDGSFSPNDFRKKLFDNFIRNNPDIQVNLIPITAVTIEDYFRSIQKSFSEKKDPDIFFDWGRKYNLLEYINKDQLLDLTDKSDHLNFCQAAKDAMSLQGKLYGVAPLWEIAGLYINETKLKELDLSLPKTLDELEKTADGFLAHGIQPFACGSQDKWPLILIFCYLAERYAANQLYRAVFERSIRFDSEPFIKATLKIQEWSKRGYFGKNPLSEDYQKAIDLMWTGKAGMQVSGTWLIAAFLDKQKTSQSFGFYPFPVMAGKKENGNLVFGMPDFAFVASKNTYRKKDTVLRFFKYILSKDVYRDNIYGVSSVQGIVSTYPLINMGNDILQKADYIQYWSEQDLPKDLISPYLEMVYTFLQPETDIRAALTKMEDMLILKLGPLKK